MYRTRFDKRYFVTIDVLDEFQNVNSGNIEVGSWKGDKRLEQGSPREDHSVFFKVTLD